MNKNRYMNLSNLKEFVRLFLRNLPDNAPSDGSETNFALLFQFIKYKKKIIYIVRKIEFCSA